MPNTITDADRGLTREDALKFCGSAMRNWQHLSFDEEELEDFRVELERFRLQSLKDAQAEIAELWEVLAEVRKAAAIEARCAEGSANIMRDKNRTGNWSGAERTAKAFDSLQKQQLKIVAKIDALTNNGGG